MNSLISTGTRPKHAEVSGIRTLYFIFCQQVQIFTGVFFFFLSLSQLPSLFNNSEQQCDVCRLQVFCLSSLCVCVCLSLSQIRRTRACLDPKSPPDKIFRNSGNPISQPLSKQNFKTSLPGLSQNISEAGIRKSTNKLGCLWNSTIRQKKKFTSSF